MPPVYDSHAYQSYQRQRQMTLGDLLLENRIVFLQGEIYAGIVLGKDGQPVLYCTLSVSADGWISANLLAPLAINPVSRTGRQLVLDESAYTTTHTIAQVSTEAD